MSVEAFLKARFSKCDGEPFLEGILSTEGADACARIQSAMEINGVSIGRKNDCACSGCKGDVFCGYADLGGIDFHQCFWHLCTNCYDAKYCEERHIREVSSASELSECPYCGGFG
jgi:hypothetical protein